MRALRVVCLAVIAAGVVWAARGAALRAERARPPARPNVLLVSIDSLRPDHLRCYGYDRDTSPTIDRLAREGVLFENAISSAPWTVPAHMTMLTGLPPELHGVTSVRQSLVPDAVTLAEVLQDAGYDTAAFVSGPTVMAHFGFGQGFALFDESQIEVEPERAGVVVTSPGLVDLVDGYLERWDYSGRRQPFFVFLHLWDVHYDYVPPPPYDAMFGEPYTGDLDARDFERNPRIRNGMDPRDLARVIALYDGEIRFTDEHLGKIVARLERLGALDDTIVVVTSDHGEEFFEHGMKGHAKSLYDEVLRVPLVVRYPRRVGFGQRVAEQVRLMDVPPTILGLAGIVPPAGFGAGELAAEHRYADLTPHVAGRRPKRPLPALPAFSDNRAGFFGHQQSLRTASAKLIHQEKTARPEAAVMVFDLAADPHERKNLYGTGTAQPLLGTLEPVLAAWNEEAARSTQLAALRKPSPRHDARLRALGYIE